MLLECKDEQTAVYTNKIGEDQAWMQICACHGAGLMSVAQVLTAGPTLGVSGAGSWEGQRIHTSRKGPWHADASC